MTGTVVWGSLLGTLPPSLYIAQAAEITSGWGGVTAEFTFFFCTPLAGLVLQWLGRVLVLKRWLRRVVVEARRVRNSDACNNNQSVNLEASAFAEVSFAGPLKDKLRQGCKVYTQL